MGRTPTVTTAAELAEQAERVWQWLVRNGHATADANRHVRTNEVRALSGGDEDRLISRAKAAALAFQLLYIRSLETVGMPEHRLFLEAAASDVKEIQRLMASLGERIATFVAKAKADRAPLPRGIQHRPSATADLFEARLVGLYAAQLIVTDLSVAVSAHPEHLDEADNVALILREGGFADGEIADLLETQTSHAFDAAPKAKADRTRKRIERARNATGADRMSGRIPSRDNPEKGAEDRLQDARRKRPRRGRPRPSR